MDIDLMTGGSNWEESAALGPVATRGGVFGDAVHRDQSSAVDADHGGGYRGARVVFYHRDRRRVSLAARWCRPRSRTRSTATPSGRFRLGLGSQVKAHVTRRYASEFDRPAARLRDYVLAVKACLRAFNREEKLAYDGEFYKLSLLPDAWAPKPHEHPTKIDISAVGSADGEGRRRGRRRCARSSPAFDDLHRAPTATGVSGGGGPRQSLCGRRGSDRSRCSLARATPPEERAPYLAKAKRQIGFYGSTPNYAFQFDDLGFEGTTGRIREKMKAGDLDGVADVISDEMLDHFAVVASWDEMADRLLARYSGTAARVVMYLGEPEMRRNPEHLAKWGEVAAAVRAG